MSEPMGLEKIKDREKRIAARDRQIAKELAAIAARPPVASRALTVGIEQKLASFSPVPQWQNGQPAFPDMRYETLAREGYGANELIYACIEELSTSAAEPGMMARQGDTWTHDHPILNLLNRPNPFMDRFEFVATVIMHRSIAGNAYAFMVRSGSGRVVQLWLLRPDRVRIVPSSEGFISHYLYQIGGADAVPLPVGDVMHFKTRHPLNDFYGMPPLMALAGRADIDNYMRDFVKAFFLNAGVPAGLLNIKQGLRAEDREEIRRRFRGDFGGPQGWHDLMIIDNSEATFTALTSNLGQRGLVIPELDEINEARIPSVFGVPQSLIGTRTSYQNGGYANKRAEETHFWTGTLTPLYKEIAGPINLRLVPNFRVDEVAFDLSEVRALQPDEDAFSTRIVREYEGGVRSLEEARRALDLPEKADPGHSFLIPSGSTPRMGANPVPEPAASPAPREPVASSNGSRP